MCRCSLRFYHFYRFPIERPKRVRARLSSLVGDHAVGKIPARVEYDQASVNCRPVCFHIFRSKQGTSPAHKRAEEVLNLPSGRAAPSSREALPDPVRVPRAVFPRYLAM